MSIIQTLTTVIPVKLVLGGHGQGKEQREFVMHKDGL